MKKYMTPTVSTIGTLADLTSYDGNTAGTDVVYDGNGKPIATSFGSTDSFPK